MGLRAKTEIENNLTLGAALYSPRTAHNRKILHTPRITFNPRRISAEKPEIRE
jgi:hypothetical protein